MFNILGLLSFICSSQEDNVVDYKKWEFNIFVALKEEISKQENTIIIHMGSPQSMEVENFIDFWVPCFKQCMWLCVSVYIVKYIVNHSSSIGVLASLVMHISVSFSISCTFAFYSF